MKVSVGLPSLLVVLVLVVPSLSLQAACVSVNDSGVPVTIAPLTLNTTGSPAMVGWLRARALNERNQSFAAAAAAMGEFAKDLIRAVYNVELARIAHVHEADPVQAYQELVRARRFLEGGSGERQQARQALDDFIANYSDDKSVCARINDAAFQALKRELQSML